MDTKTFTDIVKNLKLNANMLRDYELSEYPKHPANKSKRDLIDLYFNCTIKDIELLEKELGLNNE